MNKYEIILNWSEEDFAFIAEVPELPGCIAHGDTYESTLWKKTAEEFDDPIPAPKGRRLAFA